MLNQKIKKKKKMTDEELFLEGVYKRATIQKKQTVLTSLDKNEDGYISIKEYLDSVESLGPKEESKGNFKFYAQRNLAILFILTLIKNKKKYINKIACVPLFILCMYQLPFPGMPYYTMKNIIKDKKLTCPDNYAFTEGSISSTLSSIFVLNAPLNSSTFKIFDRPQILTPPNLREIIHRCETDGKYMVICNLTLSSSDHMNQTTHANVLIFDTSRKTIERFDPHGGNQYFDVMFKYDYNYGKYLGIKNKSRTKYNQDALDIAIRNKLREDLPEYLYYGCSSVTPYLGPQ